MFKKNSRNSSYGVSTFLGHFKFGHIFEFWFGLSIGLLNILMLTILLFRSVRSEIYLNDVKSLKLRHWFGNKFPDIKLNRNRLRRANLVDNSSDLEEYIKTNLKTKYGRL